MLTTNCPTCTIYFYRSLIKRIFSKYWVFNPVVIAVSIWDTFNIKYHCTSLKFISTNADLRVWFFIKIKKLAFAIILLVSWKFFFPTFTAANDGGRKNISHVLLLAREKKEQRNYACTVMQCAQIIIIEKRNTIFFIGVLRILLKLSKWQYILEICSSSKRYISEKNARKYFMDIVEQIRLSLYYKSFINWVVLLNSLHRFCGKSNRYRGFE